ncbi:diguanylate cyclase [Tahibacter sp. UC22_41]|uniref:GGDEF domain-containing protein n=1 Tax=Tahibacter sp. UC22_41 TaxID=3350178 RepID=UPI0036DE93B5
MTASSYLAVALCALAFVLALAFRRHRAAQLLAAGTLAVGALSLPAGDGLLAARAAEAATMFLPGCWLLALLLPEPPLRSRRMLGFALVLALAVALTALAPTHVWDALQRVLPLGGVARPWREALALNLLAAAIATGQWLYRRRPLDAFVASALLLAAGGWLQLAGLDLRSWLLAGAAVLGVGVVYSSWRLAFLDALTGLPNRRALDETLARLSGDYALAMVDVDHFKQFNDKHGHDAGDRVLAAVARSLAQTRTAQAFRFGGEEFCLLFRRPEQAKAACEDARVAIEALRVSLPAKPAAPKNGKTVRKSAARAAPAVQVTASLGLAQRSAARRTPAEVLKAADQCLYKAKDKGRNQVVASA